MASHPSVADTMNAGHSRAVVSFTASAVLVGRRLADLGLTERHRIECLGILRGPRLVCVSEDPALEEDDTLLLLGRRPDLQRFGEAHCR